MKANQERFEEAYARANDVLPGAVAAARLPNGSYGHPAISRAWLWYQEGSRDADDNMAEALASTQAELGELRPLMTKALDLLDVLTETKYTTKAFTDAVDEADTMLAHLRGKVTLEQQA